jgi:DNA-binding IclR family transcriptional regulator
MLSHVGWRGPLHATASGKVLLSFSDQDFIQRVMDKPLKAYTANTITDPSSLKQELQKIKDEQFAEENEELSEGLACIAVPVFLKGKQVAALSVSGPKHRMEKLKKEKLVDLLHETSKKITEKMN